VSPARVAALLLLAIAATACGPTYVAVIPTEAIVADAPDVHAEVSRVFVSSELREQGLGADMDLVVELRVSNAGKAPRRIAPGSFSCLMAIDEDRPEETRALLPGGGGEGAFPGEPPGEGSLLAAITVPPGETRAAWALFHGYRFDDSEVPRKILLRVPVEGGAPLTLVLAEPRHGRLRWETPPVRSAWAIGLHNGSTFASGLRTNITSTEIGKVTLSGPLLWDVSLISTVLVQQAGPLVSETSAFTATGFSAHASLPVHHWDGRVDRGHVGVYGGGSAQLMVELAKPHSADDMFRPHVYGLFQAEGGLELAFGSKALAGTPFPLKAQGRTLPSWFFHVGYQQTWAGGVTSGGIVSSLRFVF
jgi:hypothetical protein